MSPALISILVTLGAATWIYTKLQRISGNNTQQSVIGVGVAAILIFLVCFYVAHLLLK